MRDPLRLEDLPEVAPGTAYVRDVRRNGELVSVLLEYPLGRYVVCVPAFEPVAAGRSFRGEGGLPVAVLIRNSKEGLQCTILSFARRRPKRTAIGLLEALRLAENGVHAVIVSVRGD